MYKIFKINELGEQKIGRLYSLRKEIDFSPYYQRFSRIWDDKKRKLLIDTIINNFDIPKFYLNYFIEEKNELNINNFLYAIIDGKQRLEAIFDFLDNKYPLDNELVFIENEDIKIHGLLYNDLLRDYPDIASRIENYALDVVFITTDDPSRLEELFLRLNGGVALTNAEKRNAISSPLNEKIRDIVKNNDFFLKTVRFNNIRYQYNDLLTKLFYIESQQSLCDLGNKDLENFLREWPKNHTDNDLNKLIEKTLSIIDVFNRVFETKDSLLNSKGVIPVYYQFIKDKSDQFNPISELKRFIKEFDILKQTNRKEKNPKDDLLEFDRFNQQGVHRKTSLEYRYKMLSIYLEIFKSDGRLGSSINTGLFSNIDTEDFDEF